MSIAVQSRREDDMAQAGRVGLLAQSDSTILVMETDPSLNPQFAGIFSGEQQGIFDFIAETGDKLFSTDADAAESIRKQLAAGFPRQISDLSVAFDDGVATLSGACDCARTKRLAALTADNIEGVRRVVADGLSVMETEGDAGLAPAEAVPDSPATDAPVADEFYVVQKGDSLSAIAKRLYGDPMAYKRIFEANQGVIKDPNLIYPGQKTLIPRS